MLDPIIMLQIWVLRFLLYGAFRFLNKLVNNKLSISIHMTYFRFIAHIKFSKKILNISQQKALKISYKLYYSQNKFLQYILSN